MWRIVLLCSLLSFTLSARAETDAYNRVDFQVEASREIANDLLTASLLTEIQDKQPGRVAQQLNSILNDALRQAAAFSGVKMSSGNQRTYPVYGKNNQISGWRGQGEIRLESRDFKAAGELIMLLQTTMQLGNVQFSVSTETRSQAENTLITEAIQAFQLRSEAIRTATGAKSYKTVHFSINQNGMPQHFALMRAAADSAIPAPEFAAGDSHLTVQINGTIELQ